MDRTTEGRQRRRAKGSKGHERTFSKDLEVSYSDHDSFTSNLPFPLKVSRLANTALSTFMYCTAQNRKTKTLWQRKAQKGLGNELQVGSLKNM